MYLPIINYLYFANMQGKYAPCNQTTHVEIFSQYLDKCSKHSYDYDSIRP